MSNHIFYVHESIPALPIHDHGLSLSFYYLLMHWVTAQTWTWEFGEGVWGCLSSYYGVSLCLIDTVSNSHACFRQRAVFPISNCVRIVEWPDSAISL